MEEAGLSPSGRLSPPVAGPSGGRSRLSKSAVVFGGTPSAGVGAARPRPPGPARNRRRRTGTRGRAARLSPTQYDRPAPTFARSGDRPRGVTSRHVPGVCQGWLCPGWVERARLSLWQAEPAPPPPPTVPREWFVWNSPPPQSVTGRVAGRRLNSGD